MEICSYGLLVAWDGNIRLIGDYSTRVYILGEVELGALIMRAGEYDVWLLIFNVYFLILYKRSLMSFLRYGFEEGVPELKLYYLDSYFAAGDWLFWLKFDLFNNWEYF